MTHPILQEDNLLVEVPPPLSEKKVRVQLDFDQADMLIINELVATLGLGTRAELFRSGLRAVRWMAQKKQQNCSIFALAPDGRYLEPEFDFLDAVSTFMASPDRKFPSRGDEASAQAEYVKETSHV